MKENLRDINAGLMKWIIVVVAALTPLLFMPLTFDFFEFPKQIFLWVAAAILLVLWLMRFVLDNEVKVVKTPIDLPIILFIIVASVSTLLSSSRYTSLVGFFGRPDGGLAGIIALAIIFYVAVAAIRSIKDVMHVIIALLGSSAVLALLSLFYYFGLYILPWNASKVATFSPAGGVYALTVLLATVVPLALGLLLYSNSRQTQGQNLGMNPEGGMPVRTRTAPVSPVMGALLAVAALFYLASIVLFGTTAGYAGLIAGLAVFFLWSKRGQVKSNAPYLLAIAVAAGLWFALAGIPQVRQSIPGLNRQVTSPATLTATQSWKIANRTLSELPFLGSGPATYLFDFTRFKDAQYNIGDEWNLRFVVAHNQYLQIMTTMGLFGLVAYLFLLFKLASYGFKNVLVSRDAMYYPLKVGLFAALIAFMAATLFTASTTAIMVVFFLSAALLMVLERLSGSPAVSERKLAFVLSTQGHEQAKATNAIPWLLFVPGVVLAIGVLFLTAQYVRANAYYVAGVTALSSGKPDAASKGLEYQTQAVRINPWEDAYHRDLARTSFNLALALSQKPDLTEQERQTVAALLQQAVGQAQQAARLSPLNVNNWQTLADIYRRIAAQVNGAGDAALAAFANAIRIDPTNPQQLLDVGGIFFAANSYDRAIDAFKQAVSLKPNMANAYYNLANAYVKKEEYNNAWQAYQAARTLISQLPGDEAVKKDSIEKLEKEMETIRSKVTTQSAQPAQPGQAQPTPTPAAASATPTPAGTARPGASATPILRNITPAPSASPAGR